MNDKLLEKFDLLDINDKRNQISNELIIINELIKNFELQNNIQPISNVKNYDKISDNTLDESQMLTFIYEDIYNIQQELLTLLAVINKNS